MTADDLNFLTEKCSHFESLVSTGYAGKLDLLWDLECGGACWDISLVVEDPDSLHEYLYCGGDCEISLTADGLNFHTEK